MIPAQCSPQAVSLALGSEAAKQHQNLTQEKYPHQKGHQPPLSIFKEAGAGEVAVMKHGLLARHVQSMNSQ